MTEQEIKQAVQDAIRAFGSRPCGEAAIALCAELGYRSDKRLSLEPNTAATFVATFGKDKPLNAEHAILSEWQSVDFLFQLTDDEIRAAVGSGQQQLFKSVGKWNGAIINSYLLFAIHLQRAYYTRTELAGITRAVNRLFQMPALIVFRHGDTVTLAVIHRRQHRRDESKDVLEKVTLIKDISIASPHRAHIEILFDLSLPELMTRHNARNWVEVARRVAADARQLGAQQAILQGNRQLVLLGAGARSSSRKARAGTKASAMRSASYDCSRGSSSSGSSRRRASCPKHCSTSGGSTGC